MSEPRFAKEFTIAGRPIGAGHPCLLVAELSANHHGDFERALALVRAAHEAGADAVKFQTFTADGMTLDAAGPQFEIPRIGSPWDGRRLHALYAEAAMPWDWQPRLAAAARELGLIWFSTAYDVAAVDFLASLDAPAYKIASFELVDTPLLERVASTGRPVILSTGMAALEEIELAAATLADAGCRELALLKCTSAYPAPADEMHLRTIPDLAARFGLPAGLSDHSLELAVPVAAAALGAAVIEKHLTLSRHEPGPDSAFSLEPHEFRAMADAVRMAERALGRVAYGPAEHEALALRGRRSLFVVRDVRAGEPLSTDTVRSIRPADGLPPRHLPEVIGRRAACDIRRGTPLAWEMIA
jgi:N-acetylneuraminate synthase